MRSLRELLGVATEVVEVASRTVRETAPGVLTGKGDRDMATEVDLAVEETVRRMLLERTPEIGVLGEEHGRTGDASSGLWWALDPVDGTVNFAHGLPLCAVSLGLVSGQTSIVGVIDLPFLGECYTAVDGGGAECNGRPIAASRTTRLDEALIAFGDFAIGAGALARNEERLRLIDLLAARAQRVRMLGTAAICLSWTAAGRFDASVSFSNRPWDTSAGTLIAREAGLAILDLDGSPHTVDSTGTIAAVPALADQLIDLISRARQVD